jgi:hypothetical protein
MTTSTVDFNLWDTASIVPVVEVAGDPDFNLWVNLVPMCDVGQTLGAPTTSKRRIAFIF